MSSGIDKNAGIYQINIGPYFYYGQTINLSRREQQHKGSLASGMHPNYRLQSAYNKHKEFKWKVCLLCDANNLNLYESILMDNISDKNFCCNLMKASLCNDYTTDVKIKNKISESRLKRFSIEEHRIKNKIQFGRPVGATFNDQYCVEFLTVQDAADFFRYDLSTFFKILTGKRPHPVKGRLENVHLQFLPKKPQPKKTRIDKRKTGLKIVFKCGFSLITKDFVSGAKLLNISKSGLTSYFNGSRPWPGGIVGEIHGKKVSRHIPAEKTQTLYI